MKFPLHITKDSLTVLIDGKAWQTDSTNPSWDAIIVALNDDDTTAEHLVKLLSPEQLVKSTLGQLNLGAEDVVGVSNGSVWFKGEVVNNALCNIILNIASQGLNPQPWLHFTNKLFQNPSETARNELYLWLEKAQLPIAPDGDFLAYKRVRDNYRDIHSGQFDNSVGQVVSMPRENVDPIRANLCSTGLHFCSKDYLPHFGGYGGNKVVLVKINPADVVSIPSDYDNAKGRTWRYEVVGEIDPAEVGLHVWPAIATGFDDYSWDDDEADYDFRDDEYTDEELGFEDEVSDEEREFDAYLASLQIQQEEVNVTVEPVIHSKTHGDVTRATATELLSTYGSQAGIARALGKSTGTIQAWFAKLFA